MNNRTFGAEGEAKAADFLLLKGYQIVTKNWALGAGELDIIARDGDGTLVFVEVKRVAREDFGNAAWKMTPEKIRQVQKIAQMYIKDHQLGLVRHRYDLIAITADKIEHYKNIVHIH